MLTRRYQTKLNNEYSSLCVSQVSITGLFQVFYFVFKYFFYFLLQLTWMVVSESSKHRLSIPLVKCWMGWSTTVKNDQKLEVSDCSRVSACFGFTYISLKFRDENEVVLVSWTGPGVALEILRLWEYPGEKTVEIFVVWKYICIVVIIQDGGQIGAFNVDTVNAVGTANLE